MQILVCIDDTDNLESRGTGEIAELIAHGVEQNGWGATTFVTRHQLYVHPDIPYTSHNSAMCFSADVQEGSLDRIIDYACNFLATESAPGSDPGLCVAVLDRLKDPASIIGFGQLAKKAVIAKTDAYSLAQELGVHLSEHGGTGQGVIGALAGTGLRLGGNDGRLKGNFSVQSANGICSVAELLNHDAVGAVQSITGEAVDPQALVRVDDRLKTVYLDGKAVLLVTQADEKTAGAAWQTCSKQQLKKY